MHAGERGNQDQSRLRSNAGCCSISSPVGALSPRWGQNHNISVLRSLACGKMPTPILWCPCPSLMSCVTLGTRKVGIRRGLRGCYFSLYFLVVEQRHFASMHARYAGPARSPRQPKRKARNLSCHRRFVSSHFHALSLSRLPLLEQIIFLTFFQLALSDLSDQKGTNARQRQKKNTKAVSNKRTARLPHMQQGDRTGHQKPGG